MQYATAQRKEVQVAKKGSRSESNAAGSSDTTEPPPKKQQSSKKDQIQSTLTKL
jgi:hypothetical protein